MVRVRVRVRIKFRGDGWTRWYLQQCGSEAFTIIPLQEVESWPLDNFMFLMVSYSHRPNQWLCDNMHILRVVLDEDDMF